MRWLARLVWATLAASAFVSTAAADDAPADEKRICAAASERSQELRGAGKLRSAREQLLVCVRDTCPGVVSTDCRQWLDEVERSLPTVVLGMRDASGRDATDVRVTVDGELLVDKLRGQAVAVDPGEHLFRFEPRTGPPLETRALVREGEKGRAVLVAAPTPPPEERPGAGRRILAYSLGAVGIVAIGVGVFFEIAGKTEIDDLRASCRPGCAPADVDAARSKLLVGDISIGAGVITIGVAALLLLLEPPARDPHRAAVVSDPARPRGSLGLAF